MNLYSNLIREAKFLLRQRHLVAFFTIVFLLCVFAVGSGISETQTQLTTIERLIDKDTVDRNSVLAKQSDYGSAAYYSFHLTYAPPSPMAFAAMGQRDIYPWKHRIRMLALEGQIYETDSDNPELSFLGRFDFSFLVSVLMPLFVILLLHDLRSAERSAGRYDLLITTASKANSLWLSRASVLCLTLALVICLPLIIGALFTQASLIDAGLMVLVVIGHLLFWMGLTLWFTSTKIAAKQSSAQTASVLLAIWLSVTVLLPVGSDIAIDEMVQSPNGGEIVMTQREAVNDAWDVPVTDTWREFLATHPQWHGHTTMGPAFEWKWYYAFQQVGDQHASELSQAYRDATLAKDQLASSFSLLSPPMLTQRLLSGIAATNTAAAMKYEQDVRAFHRSLRLFYYPLLFNADKFDVDTFTQLPQFTISMTNLATKKEKM